MSERGKRKPGSGILGDIARALGGAAVNTLIGLTAICVVWQLLMGAANLTAFDKRGPLQEWHFLFRPSNGAGRHMLWIATVQTARDAGLGLVLGTLAGLLVAMAFNRWRVIEQATMPVAMALRSVPLVAMTPVIVLVFGRDLLGVTVITGVVTFFPVLVNVSIALRSVPTSSMDLMNAYGARRGTTLRRVQLPYSLPALFASIRIAAPLAIVGACLAEYLATGQGLGYLELTSASSYDFDLRWTSIAFMTFGAVILYQFVAALEQVVLQRFAADPDRR